METEQLKEQNIRRLGCIGGIIAALFVIGAIFVWNCIERVPQGNQAVLYTPSGVSEQTKPAGWHWVSPFVKAVHYPIRTQTVEYKDLNVATKDGKNLAMDISVNYHVDPTKVVNIFNKFGNADIAALETGFLRTRIQDATRQSVSKYSVIDTFGVKTSEIKRDTLSAMQSNLEKQGFIIEDIALSSPKADQATQSAIDERVKANQELERAKTDREIAEQNALKKEVEAKGEAKANEIVDKSLTDQLIRQKMIDKWDGKQPISIGGDGVMVDMTGN